MIESAIFTEQTISKAGKSDITKLLMFWTLFKLVFVVFVVDQGSCCYRERDVVFWIRSLVNWWRLEVAQFSSFKVQFLVAQELKVVFSRNLNFQVDNFVLTILNRSSPPTDLNQHQPPCHSINFVVMFVNVQQKLLIQNSNPHQKITGQVELGKWWFWTIECIITNNTVFHHVEARGSLIEWLYMVCFVVLLNFLGENHLFCDVCHFVLSNKGNVTFWWTTAKSKTISYIEWATVWGSVQYITISDERRWQKFCIVILMDFIEFFGFGCNDSKHQKVSYYMIIMIYWKRKKIIVEMDHGINDIWLLFEATRLVLSYYYASIQQSIQDSHLLF